VWLADMPETQTASVSKGHILSANLLVAKFSTHTKASKEKKYSATSTHRKTWVSISKETISTRYILILTI
jgi:hypothetical protein